MEVGWAVTDDTVAGGGDDGDDICGDGVIVPVTDAVSAISVGVSLFIDVVVAAAKISAPVAVALFGGVVGMPTILVSFSVN